MRSFFGSGKVLLACASMACMAMVSSVNAQNLIGDGSFETPQGAAGSEIGALGAQGTPWSTFNAAFLENANTPSNPEPAEDGNQYIKTFGGGSGAFQDIAVTPGQTFNASAWGRLPSTDHAAAGASQFGQLLIIFQDPTDTTQVGSTLASTLVSFGQGGPDTPADVWENGTLSGTVPAGVGFIRLQLNEGASAGGSVFFDNASLTVPEPMSLSLAGLAGLTMLRRRCR